MRPERWNQIEGLFLQAIELPAKEREGFLDDVCNGDESLRRDLNSLLACDVPETPLVNGSFLPHPFIAGRHPSVAISPEDHSFTLAVQDWNPWNSRPACRAPKSGTRGNLNWDRP